ncbi:SRPBCC family protein [Amycolatopsis antarctica]|nr:SRPBCC family protein [Amycolatopsis antarctica]
MTTTSPLGTVDRATGSAHLERTLSASRETVWQALTDPVRLGAWLAPVERGTPADGEFVLRMNGAETATCTVTTWDPPDTFAMTWDYTGEGPSRLRFRLQDTAGGTLLVLDHDRLPVDPVQYGAGWHVHLDNLGAHLSGVDSTAGGCADPGFLVAYAALEDRYAAIATGAPADAR